MCEKGSSLFLQTRGQKQELGRVEVGKGQTSTGAAEMEEEETWQPASEHHTCRLSCGFLRMVPELPRPHLLQERPKK